MSTKLRQLHNIDQSDLDHDGVGDACDRMTCGNGVREPGEQCDDGNTDEGDWCSPRCLTPAGELLAFFDTSVKSGGLVGTGRGHSAAERLEILRHELEALARGFGKHGRWKGCERLASLLSQVDGSPRPPDLVTGTDRAELAGRIAALQEDLSCRSHPRRSPHDWWVRWMSHQWDGRG